MFCKMYGFAPQQKKCYEFTNQYIESYLNREWDNPSDVDAIRFLSI